MKSLNNTDNFINLLIFSIICFFGSGWITVYFGSIGKYGSMLSGMIILCYLSYKRIQYINASKILPYLLLIIGYYIAFQAIAFFRLHYFDLKVTIFGLNGLVFMLAGSILGASSHAYYLRNSNHQRAKKRFEKTDYLLPLFFLFGLLSTNAYTNSMQALFLMGGGRDLGDGSTNPVGIAYVFSIVNICIIYYLIIQRNIFLKLLSGALFLSTLFIIISTTSRGAILYCILTYAIVSVSLIPKIKANFNISWLLSALFLCISITVLPLFLASNEFFAQRFNSLIYRFVMLWDFFNYTSAADQSADSRIQIYQMWLSQAGEWLLFGQKFYAGAISYPHNSLLEIAARFGVFGWPLIVLLVLTFIKSLLRLFNTGWFKNKEWYFFLLLFLFAFFQSMTSLSLEINRALWFAFGYMLMYKNKS